MLDGRKELEEDTNLGNVVGANVYRVWSGWKNREPWSCEGKSSGVEEREKSTFTNPQKMTETLPGGFGDPRRAEILGEGEKGVQN